VATSASGAALLQRAIAQLAQTVFTKNRLGSNLKVISNEKILFIALALASATAHASKVFLALIPTNGPLHAVVTVMEKPCTSAEGNALYMVGKTASMGCWKLDGKQVRVEWQSGDAPTTFDFEAFKVVSDDGDAATAMASKKGSTTYLNCTAQGWVGDLAVERDETGVLKNSP